MPEPDSTDITGPATFKSTSANTIQAGRIIVGAVHTWHDPGYWNLPQRRPNRWHRFWAWALLGWKWKSPE